MSESTYDTLIAPELLRIAELCHEHGMAFVASVEYAPDKLGTTVGRSEHKSAAQFLAEKAALCHGNFDSLGIAVCRKYDVSASVFLSKFGTKESTQ